MKSYLAKYRHILSLLTYIGCIDKMEMHPRNNSLNHNYGVLLMNISKIYITPYLTNTKYILTLYKIVFALTEFDICKVISHILFIISIYYNTHCGDLVIIFGCLEYITILFSFGGIVSRFHNT